MHAHVYHQVASYLGKPASLVVGMGFATNSSLLPALVDPNGDGDGVLALSGNFCVSSVYLGNFSGSFYVYVLVLSGSF